MIYSDILAFFSSLTKEGRIMGIDMGTKNIGIAVSDLGRSLSTPKTTIRRKGNIKDIADIKDLVAQHKIVGIIMGLPLNMDGSESEMSAFVRRFTENLLKEIDIALCFFDERLSSSEAEDFLKEQVGISQDKIAKIVDQTAASFILQRAIDYSKRSL